MTNMIATFGEKWHKSGTKVCKPLLWKSGTKVAIMGKNCHFCVAIVTTFVPLFHKSGNCNCHFCATFVPLFTKSGIYIFGFMAISGNFHLQNSGQSSPLTLFILDKHISHTCNSSIPCACSVAITMLACCVLHTIYLPTLTSIMLAFHCFSHNTAFAATTTALFWWVQIGSHQWHVMTTIGATSFLFCGHETINSIALVCSKRLSGCQQPQ